jgi:type VI secretion system protein VasG
MILVDAKPLLQKLNRHCLRALEGSVGLCVARSHPEVTVEHVLLRLLDEPMADIPLILKHYEADPAQLARSLEHALEQIKDRTTGKPVFSPVLFEWFQDAWVVSSVELNQGALRSGALLRVLASRPSRYLNSDLPSLERVRPEDLRHHFREIVSGSVEEGMAAESPPPLGGALARRAAGPAGEAARTALGRFATSFTEAARQGRIDPVFGRDREIRQVIDILGRRRKNNPIVIGDAGVGKTAIVEGLALRIAEGDVPDMLRDVDIQALDIGSLQAGAGVKGEFESRLKAVIEEVRAAGQHVILFIDEAHTIIGAGGPQGGSDAANLLKPALARGELRTIAATTWGEYKKYFEEDAALARRFQPVKIDEPSVDDAILMLRGLKEKYEASHGVRVRDDAIEASVRLSARYIAGRLLPDKAVDLLDTTAARVKIGQSSRPGQAEDLDRRIGALGRELSALTRDRDGGLPVEAERITALEGTIRATTAERDSVVSRWQAQREIVQRVSALRAAPPTEESEKAIAGALRELTGLQGRDPLVRLEVDPEIVAQVVSDWTGVPVGRMLADDAQQILKIEEHLGKRIRGQDHVLRVVGRALRGAKAGLKDPGKPQVFLLVGPSGVGKTELGLAVADLMFGGERFTVSINMSEYQDREMGVSGLIGAKPGYVGYGKGGALTEAVRQRPYSVVLLDEIEKACQEVRNLFYQVFDKGNLTDGTGRTVDFKNTVIFLTTNLGAERIASACEGEAAPDPAEVVAVLRPMLNKALQPAWLARTTVVPFFPLGRAALAEIAEMKLLALGKRVQTSYRAELRVGAGVVDHVVSLCVDAETGARNIDFVVNETILPLLSARVLERMAEGGRVPGMTLVVEGRGLELRFD